MTVGIKKLGFWPS